MSYTFEKVVADGDFPRLLGSTVSPDDRVQVVYAKFKTTKPISENKMKINLVFAHGTGMNKAIFYYHIRKLYELNSDKWQLNTVISVDTCNHGDSALLNRSKNASYLPWNQGGKDIIAVIKREQAQGEFAVARDSLTIGIGHSMGGSMMLFAALYEPSLFDSIITLEPVILVHEVGIPRFQKILGKLLKIGKDTFNSEKEYDTFFQKGSIYTSFHPEVLKDFQEDEKYFEDGKVKTKCTVHDQILTYHAFDKCLPFLMDSLPHFEIPICHAIGVEATWNPKESIPWIREKLPQDKVEGVDVEGGEHLMVGTLPDKMVEIFHNWIDKRTDLVLAEGDHLKWVKYRGDPAELLAKSIREMDLSKAKL